MKQIFFITFLVISFLSYSQTTQLEYIEQYKDLAISEMKRTNVPASITLAQGLLESNYGNSRLAKKGNNHFGIKCNNNWTGPGIYENDDAPNECFRKYDTPEESYKDHSDFLRKGSRYAFLFDYDITDYKSWSYGLKKAGYATNPIYAEKLIELIERYNLNQYDIQDNLILAQETKIEAIINNEHETKPKTETHFVVQIDDIIENGHEIFVYNDIPYIIINNDTYVKNIAKEMNLMKLQVRFYNDLGSRKELKKGEVIYLKPKKNSASKGNKYHIVAQDETLQYISQIYGIKLNKLCNKNNITKESQPSIGTKLKLQ